MNRVQPEATHVAARMSCEHLNQVSRQRPVVKVGKQADFCVLDDDPTTVASAELHQVRIAGTVFGGRPT